MSTQTEERTEREDQAPAQDTAGQPAEDQAAEPQVQQPAEVDDYSKAVEVHSPKGALTLRPGQTHLDENQTAALIAIGIDVKGDPRVGPHVRPFMHMCQVRGLDPFVREAYLIGRGKGDDRKYTMQVGIDGYRKMAGSTGRFIRVKKTLWTGTDDDDRSYRMVTDEDGDVVMQRVWFDQWPASRGNPGAAKVVLEHYDETGAVTTTHAVADWGMYAPMKDVWAYDPQKGKRAPVVDPQTGKTVQELNDMWSKGGPHMLAKCAEALADRKAFPGAMSGVYIHEEMHRLDQIERNRQQNEQQNRRREAFEAAHAPKQVGAQASQSPATVPGETVPGETVQTESAPLYLDEPAPVAEVVPQAVQQVAERAQQAGASAPTERPAGDGERSSAPTASDAERAQWIRDELAMLAEAYGQPVSALYQRQVRALRKNAEDFTLTELRRTVAGLRKGGPAALKRAGREDESQAYTAALEAEVTEAPLHELLGHGQDHGDQGADQGAGPVAPVTDVDAAKPHAFVNNQGVCAVEGCERFEDDELHEV